MTRFECGYAITCSQMGACQIESQIEAADKLSEIEREAALKSIFSHRKLGLNSCPRLPGLRIREMQLKKRSA